MANTILDGTDLILSIGGKALAYSTSCEISDDAEMGERVTKESTSGKWKESYVKSFAEEITADGVVILDGTTDMPSYDLLRSAMLAGDPVQANYSIREPGARTGQSTAGYKGQFFITNLKLSGKAGEDATYSVTLKNSGAVEPIGNGLSTAS